MSDPDTIWNRAAEGTGGEEGDDALAALLVLHGMVMNGGLVNAIEVAEEEELHAAVEGYRFFGLDDAADLIVETQSALDNDADPEILETMKDGEFYDLVPDDETVYDAFAAKLRDEPSAFAAAD
ncbi:MAG: DUF4375 domain-containing protein [Propionibacterium sp.]|nr:DUF4375 domain-containing protein [Propionibacterium sp.]